MELGAPPYDRAPAAPYHANSVTPHQMRSLGRGKPARPTFTAVPPVSGRTAYQ